MPMAVTLLVTKPLTSPHSSPLTLAVISVSMLTSTTTVDTPVTKVVR